jgi:hypothetical protein
MGRTPDLLQPGAQPGRRRADAHVEHAPAKARAQLRRFDVHRPGHGSGRAFLADVHGQRPQRRRIQHRHLAGHAVDVHAVHAVGGDVEVEDGVVPLALDAVHGQPGQGEVLREARHLRREVDELAQPADGDLHPGNCSRKRRSLS